MIQLGKKEVIDTYYQSPALNQSLLKTVVYNSDFLKNNVKEESLLYYEEKEHFVVGNGVDCYICQGEEVFENTHYVSKLKTKPSDAVMSIVHYAVKQFNHYNPETTLEDLAKVDFTDCQSFIIDAINAQKYRADQNWGMDAKVKNVIKDGEAYFKEVILTKNKQILSKEEYDTIDSIVKNLKEHPNTANYFVDFDNNLLILFQKALYFKHRGIDCKALLDMVIVDEKNKTVSIIDIKTLGDYTNNFLSSLRRRRYDIQLAFYMLAVKYCFPDYRIKEVSFLVESTLKQGNPLVYTMSDQLIDIAINGRKSSLSPNGLIYIPEIIGIEGCFDRYIYYQENGYDTIYDFKDNKGRLIAQWDYYQ